PVNNAKDIVETSVVETPAPETTVAKKAAPVVADTSFAGIRTVATEAVPQPVVQPVMDTANGISAAKIMQMMQAAEITAAKAATAVEEANKPAPVLDTVMLDRVETPASDSVEVDARYPEGDYLDVPAFNPPNRQDKPLSPEE